MAGGLKGSTGAGGTLASACSGRVVNVLVGSGRKPIERDGQVVDAEFWHVARSVCREVERPGCLTQAVHDSDRIAVSAAVRLAGGHTVDRDSIDVVRADDVDQDGKRRHRRRPTDGARCEVTKVVAGPSDATRSDEGV